MTVNRVGPLAEKLAQLPADPAQAQSVLFVCAGNTCRSVFAEYLTRRRVAEGVRVESAGLRPQSRDGARDAIDTLRFDFQIDASDHRPRDVREVALDQFDLLVALDKSIAKELASLSSREIVVWNVTDPWGDSAIEYRRCAFRIGQLLSTLPLPWKAT